MKPVAPDASDIGNRKPEDVRVFEIGGITDTVTSLRKELFASWNQTLGEERAAGLIRSVQDWMPIDDAPPGFASSQAVFSFGHRVRYFREFERFETPQGEQTSIGWSLATPNGNAMWITIPADNIPNYLRPHLADWIEEANRSEPIPLNLTR
jgi:hypothetical protein